MMNNIVTYLDGFTSIEDLKAEIVAESLKQDYLVALDHKNSLKNEINGCFDDGIMTPDIICQDYKDYKKHVKNLKGVIKYYATEPDYKAFFKEVKESGK